MKTNQAIRIQAALGNTTLCTTLMVPTLSQEDDLNTYGDSLTVAPTNDGDRNTPILSQEDDQITDDVSINLAPTEDVEQNTQAHPASTSEPTGVETNQIANINHQAPPLLVNMCDSVMTDDFSPSDAAKIVCPMTGNAAASKRTSQEVIGALKERIED